MAPTTMNAPAICSGATAWPRTAQAMPSTAIGSKFITAALFTAPRRGSSTNMAVIAVP